jgi:hypothetical protein
MKQDGFALELAPADSAKPGFPPLRPLSISGKPLPAWELACLAAGGAAAGGCRVTLPPGRGDLPSPKQAPHPVIGEWLSALRYTGFDWVECGHFETTPVFSDEGVAALLWEGLLRLMRRNGLDFMVGAAPNGSLALDMALRRGASILESGLPEAPRYFLYVLSP